MNLKSYLTNKTYWILFTILIAGASIVRFYNFPNRINFGPEQAISLITSAGYINEKPSLLGQPYYHQTVTGQTLFYGPQFNYLLVPLLIIFKYDPVWVTAFFALVNIFCGGIIYFLTQKLVNQKVAFITLLIFLFNSTMINHSLFIWSLHFFPAIGFASFYILWNLKKDKYQLRSIFILGILSGIGISLEYPFGIYTVIMLLLVLILSRQKVLSILTFLIGNAVGDFPMVVFDLKHNFYNLRSLIGYAQLQTVHQTQGMDYFHFLELWGVFCLIIAILLQHFFGKRKLILFTILGLYIIANLVSPDVSFTKAVGMPDGINVFDIKQVAQVIAQDKPSNFNVASLVDFDTRANPLRYYITYIYKIKPKDYTQYSGLTALYTLTRPHYDFSNPSVWELQAYQPYSQQLLQSKEDTWQLSKLTTVQKD